MRREEEDKMEVWEKVRKIRRVKTVRRNSSGYGDGGRGRGRRETN